MSAINVLKFKFLHFLLEFLRIETLQNGVGAKYLSKVAMFWCTLEVCKSTCFLIKSRCVFDFSSQFLSALINGCRAMDVLVAAADQVSLEGVNGATLTKLWYELGRTLHKPISACRKLRIISYLLDLPQYKLY